MNALAFAAGDDPQCFQIRVVEFEETESTAGLSNSTIPFAEPGPAREISFLAKSQRSGVVSHAVLRLFMCLYPMKV